ncbi:nucleoside 2-deoxyribosyltransferase [Allohahella marinimesophila]|uniref:Nucleoside 2-deoxyribosyltransferase n=1 Tax=Allohahella marinimesophila TaxID=1054972 RepID=A0ABP7NYR2_9GAMM
MEHPHRIYLAGPEVFFPKEEHQTIVAEKKRLLQAQGFVGVDPLDADLVFDKQETKQAHALRIYRANRDLMDSCSAIIANLTPFRGISADPGTVFEVGYMIGHGKPAFGFTMDKRPYLHRAGAATQGITGHTIEDFELSDNLMIECGMAESGGGLYVANTEGDHSHFSSELFRTCVKALTVKSLSGGTYSHPHN